MARVSILRHKWLSEEGSGYTQAKDVCSLQTHTELMLEKGLAPLELANNTYCRLGGFEVASMMKVTLNTRKATL